MLITSESQVIIDKKISAFGRWNNSSGEFTTKGVVYAIVGDGDFDKCVKFINNQASIDEASVNFFDMATKKEYAEQFKLLEQKPQEKVVEKPNKVAKSTRV